MTRCLVAVLTTATAGVVMLGAQQATFHGGTHTVSVYATVVDGDGRLVTDLTQDDFQVFDNGKPQTLTVFKNAFQPITIVIMLDRSGSMAGNFAIERAAAEQFIAALHPDDQARLGSFSNLVRIDPPSFTSDRNELIRILRERLQEAGATPLWNATNAAMDALSRKEGRRVVLVFTDGYDSPLRPDGNVTLEQVIERSQREEIMVYAIGLADSCGGFAPAIAPGPPPETRFQRGRPRGPRIPRFPGGIGGRLPVPGRPPIVRPPFPRPDVPGRPGEAGGRTPGGAWSSAHNGCSGAKPDPGLKLLADEGGGGYFELSGGDDLGQTFARVADELHQQYLLAFSAETLDGTLHHLDVRLRDPHLIARARKSYVAAVDVDDSSATK